MADKEYIERDVVLNTIMDEPPDAHYPSWYAGKIEEIPAADVVEVVRCRNCENFEPHGNGIAGRCKDKRNSGIRYLGDFCSLGVRWRNRHENH